MATTVSERQRPRLTNPLLSKSLPTRLTSTTTGSVPLTRGSVPSSGFAANKLDVGTRECVKVEDVKGREKMKLTNTLLSGNSRSLITLTSTIQLSSARTTSSVPLRPSHESSTGLDYKQTLALTKPQVSNLTPSISRPSLLSSPSSLTSSLQSRLQSTGTSSSLTKNQKTSINLAATTSSRSSLKLSSTLTTSRSHQLTASTNKTLGGVTKPATKPPHVTSKPPPVIVTTPSLSSSLTAKMTTGNSNTLLSSKITTPPFSTQSSVLSTDSYEPRRPVTPKLHPPSNERFAVKTVSLHSEALPVYDFTSARPATSTAEPDFLPPELDASIQAPPTPPMADTVQLKVTMINAVATSLLCSPDFRDPKNTTRRNLKQLGEAMSVADPEFILKLALYTRRNLNIRTTANFLLALAAYLYNCRPFLKKYFSATVRLPSDWIEISEIYQTFNDQGLHFGQLPTSLRKVMTTKFPDFDSYQLGKYNKDASKKNKKKGKGKTAGKTDKKEPIAAQRSQSNAHSSSSDSSDESSVVPDEESESEEELVRLTFTLKQLVRKLHIAEPVEHVMCLIGKRYPEDTESFRRSRLPGIWDQDRAGKRMKLATPETWETQVSLKGNKAAVWEELIDHRKLPFMAMLRNLRNLIIANVSQKHHQWVLNKLSDERAVVNSQQFPFRFFSAYEVLGDLEKLGTENATPKPPPKQQKSKKPPRKPKEIKPIDPRLLKRYKSALDMALKIATNYNVKPISGTTVILCNAGNSMRRNCTSARGLGKPRTVLEVGILLGLMCKHSCEQCTMAVYGSDTYYKVNLEEGTILHNMEAVMTKVTENKLNEEEGKLPQSFFNPLLVDRVQIDNLVILTDTMNMDSEDSIELLKFLDKYRHLVNPNLLFVSVDLSGRASGISSTIKPHHENDIHLAGYSDQILRFIAERGDSGQLSYVDNVDKAFNLVDLKQSCLQTVEAVQVGVLARERAMLAAIPQKKWRTVRVFISSTFRDMHGERDLLTRFVFPELRSRCLRRNISLYEVDLRWGVTESDARSHKAIEICLQEILRCQYFIGLIGQRYGWAPEKYQVPDSPEYDWVREYPSGRSITELEMYHAALCDTDKVVGKAFFYFRDAAINSQIPEDMKNEFQSDSHKDREKIEDLKSSIRTSGLEVYDGYPCKWMGVIDDKPIVGGLEDFGQRVLYNLWNSIQRDYPESESCEDPVKAATAVHDTFAESKASSFVGRQVLLKHASESIGSATNGLVAVAGKPGSGKTAFMAALAQYCIENTILSSNNILTHFIGAAPGSSNIATLLTRLCLELKRRFSLSLSVPEDYPDLAKEWVDFLREAAQKSSKSGTKLAIFIDGLDLLEDAHNGRSLDWLPEIFPEGVVLVTSMVDGGSSIMILRQHKPAPVEVTVGGMDMFDKAEMVRRNLSYHRKVLDESPFNNQMKLLLTKREASNPLYLHLACEELRMFGVFEEVSSFIRKMPATVSTILQEVLNRLENEHGIELLSTSLTLLCLVRSGLKEYELAGALSSFLSAGNEAGKLPPVVLARLLRSLQTFLQPTGQENSDLLKLAHKDIEKAVRSRYMRGAMADREKKLHMHLAKYFKHQADPDNNGSFKGNDARAFTELPYHLMACGSWKEMEEVLCQLNFVVAKCHLGLAQQLLEDYTPATHTLTATKAREVSRFIHLPKVKTFKSFVSRNLHILTATPPLTLQQAINEPRDSMVAQYAQTILKDNPVPVLSQVNKSEEENPCNLVLGGHGSAMIAVAVSQDGKMLVTGSKNCVVKVFEVETGREVRTYLGHAGAITGVCFVGDSAVCSASQDCSLSLWNLREGHRIAVMKGHSRAVKGCVADKNGKIVVSVSWDMSIKVWDGTDGSFKSSLKSLGKNSHINCLDIHPEGQLVAVGCWDASVKMWDTLNAKRIKVLKGHKTSVQACAYAPSGRHVVSAAMDGEVKIWSVRGGTTVGTITGHSAPVNGITFTPNGQYLATASSDKQIKVWSGSLGKPAQIIRGENERGYAHSLAFNQETQCVFTGYHNGSVCQYNSHTGALLSSVKPHTAAVKAVAYYDGLCMTASVDTTVKVWLASSSNLHCVCLEGNSSALTAATWNKHGLATASEDLSIMLWPHNPAGYKKLLNTAKPSPVKPLATLHGHTGTISAIAFSSTEGTMVTVSHDKSIIVWDTINYKPTQTIPVAHNDWINACVFSDLANDYLVTGSNDFTLKIWDIKTGSEKSVLKGHTSGINSVAFSMGCIISGAVDGSLKVWTQKGIEITTLYCHNRRINACLLNIPGKMDKKLQDSWADVVEEEEEEEKTGGSAGKLRLNLEEVSVLTASDDGTVGVWKPFLPNHLATLKGHSDRVMSLASTFNNVLISSSLDSSVRLWNPQLPTEPGTLVKRQAIEAHVGSVTDAMIRTDSIARESGGLNTFAATSGRDGTFIVWCICLPDAGEEPALEKLYQVKASEKALSSVLMTLNSGITVGKDTGEIEVWRWSTSEFPRLDLNKSAAQLAGDAPVSKMVVTSDKKFLVASSWNNQVFTLSGSSKTVSDRMKEHKESVVDVCATKQGPKTIVYSLSLDRTLSEWAMSTGSAKGRRTKSVVNTASIHRIHLEADTGKREQPWTLALCELDSSHLVISDSLGQVTIWNKVSKITILTKKVHQKAINALATINGCLVTGSDDSTVKVWRMKKDQGGNTQLKQVGHFYCQSCVTTIAVRERDRNDSHPLMLVGDSLGHVILLEWYN